MSYIIVLKLSFNLYLIKQETGDNFACVLNLLLEVSTLSSLVAINPVKLEI